MNIFKRFVFFLICMMGTSCLTFSNEILIVNELGEESFRLDATDSFLKVIEHIEEYLEIQELGLAEQEKALGLEGYTKRLKLDLLICDAGITLKPTKKNESSRNYHASVSPSEKKDIKYIVTTLAQNSLASIASSKSSLKKAGDRIDHIHPLRFLSIVFADEELKAGMHAIRDRGWIWDEFLSGVVRSLKEESAYQNMTTEFIHDFSATVKINVYAILQPIQEGRWKDLINILIDQIPRANDPSRYKM